MPEQLCANLASDSGGCSASLPSHGSTKRLSWTKLVQKFSDFGVNSSSHSLDLDSDSSSRDDESDSGSICFPNFSTSDEDVFFNPMEERLCKEVVELIACTLTDAKDGALHCSKLLIPEKLLQHIGQELVHLAASEPCGLRGALIGLCVEQGDVSQSAGQIAVDPYLVPTFQLTLVLRLDSGGLWPKIQGLFAPKSAPSVRHVLKLSTGFRVIKKKLYSSEDLLIEEC